MLLFSRQGKVRLQKWYAAYSLKDKKKIQRELVATILGRKSKMCNVLEYRELKVVYKRRVILFNALPCSQKLAVTFGKVFIVASGKLTYSHAFSY